MRYPRYRHSPPAWRLARRLSCVAGLRLTTAIAALGCGKDSLQATTQAPAPPPPLPPTQPAAPDPLFTISGVVFEVTASGRRPAVGVPLNVVSEDFFATTSDADGRYSALVRGDAFFIIPTETSAYMAPCPSGGLHLPINPTRIFDIDVVSKAVLLTTGVPDSYPAVKWAAVSGTVVEAADGRSPVVGALLTFGDGPYNSRTVSDSLGRYMICAAPPWSGSDQEITLNVTKDGYFPASRLDLGGWNHVEIVELVRK
jgi:hypothetical protein